jgi:hypothetical protein
MQSNLGIRLQRYNDRITVALGGIAFMLEMIPALVLLPINHKVSPFQNYIITIIAHSIVLPIWIATIIFFAISAIVIGQINGVNNKTTKGRLRLIGVVFAYIAFTLVLLFLGFVSIHHRI